MRLSVFGLGVAFAFASLTTPVVAADTRTSGGFSQKSDTPSPSPTRQNGGFTSERKQQVEPRVNNNPPAAVVSPPPQQRMNGGFTATPRTNDNPPAAVVAPSTARTANGFQSGAPSQQPTAQPRVTVIPPPSPVDKLAAQSNSQKAFRQFKQEQAGYKNPEVHPPASQKAAQNSAIWQSYGSGWKTPDDYYHSRQNAFARNPRLEHYYSEPPSWVQTRPAYGAYAAAFLGGALLDHIAEPSYANWAYSHASDSDVQSWHSEMIELAKTNEELRGKMAEYDRQIAELQAKNAAKTENLPSDVDPSLVVAPSTAILATSPESGHPILWGIIIGIVVIVAFLAVCIVISQRKRANRFA